MLGSPLYRDDCLAVFDKPSGLAVHRGWAREEVTLLQLARRALGRWVYPVHRLDRATSGLLVFALDPETATELQAAFGSGGWLKNYLVLTRGSTPMSGLIDHPLAKSKSHAKRPALTAFHRLATFERYSLLEVRTFTGRQHQIRRHLKHIGHPVIGDTRYGKGEHNRRFRDQFGLTRLTLHASKLAFTHPETSERLEFRAELPVDLAIPYQAMGLSQAAAECIAEPAWAPEPDTLPVCTEPERARQARLAGARPPTSPRSQLGEA